MAVLLHLALALALFDYLRAIEGEGRVTHRRMPIHYGWINWLGNDKPTDGLVAWSMVSQKYGDFSHKVDYTTDTN